MITAKDCNQEPRVSLLLLGALGVAQKGLSPPH